MAFVLELVAGTWLTNSVWPPVSQNLRWLMAQRVGFFGLLLVGLLAVMILSAFIENSPTVARLRERRKNLRPRPLSPSEYEDVQRVRELSRDDNVFLASTNLASLNEQAASYFAGRGNPFTIFAYEPAKKLRDATKAVDDALDRTPPSLSEIQEALRTFRNEYARGVAVLNRVRYVEPTFPAEEHEAKGYEEWRKAHPAVAGAYQTLIKRAAFEGDTIGWLSANSEEIGFSSDPDFRAGVRSSRIRVVYEKLALLTDDEQRFLDLFSVDTLPMKRGESDTYLDHAVYQAGKALVTKQVLNSVTVRPYVEKFCLSEEACRAWTREPRWIQQCIEIPLAVVKGTLASGSGASNASFTPPHIRPSAPNIDAPPFGKSSS
ncbi:MAG TPA: hypothetical protein VES88_16500 [Gemmatimonadaceae bacterium]|nr:hypothetical protein [Gemmatimonadaceae bacterium]